MLTRLTRKNQLLNDLTEIKAVLDVEAKMMRALMMLAAIKKLQAVA